jgi:hypothetical protein
MGVLSGDEAGEAGRRGTARGAPDKFNNGSASVKLVEE